MFLFYRGLSLYETAARRLAEGYSPEAMVFRMADAPKDASCGELSARYERYVRVLCFSDSMGWRAARRP